MTIGEKIKERRLALGLTLEEVGNAVGVAKSTVRKWEIGFIENMRTDKVAKLAKVLETTPAYLLDLPDLTAYGNNEVAVIAPETKVKIYKRPTQRGETWLPVGINAEGAGQVRVLKESVTNKKGTYTIIKAQDDDLKFIIRQDIGPAGKKKYTSLKEGPNNNQNINDLVSAGEFVRYYQQTHKEALPKSRSASRLENIELTQKEDETILEFIEFVLSKKSSVR